MAPFYRLILISQKQNIPTVQYLEFIKKCCDGGITSLQLREKSLSFAELVVLGQALLDILCPYGIPLVINDFPLLAKELQSQYLHLGQKDGAISNALGVIPRAQIGVSIDSLENMHVANAVPSLAYVTASAVFPSANKHNIQTIWGLEGLKKLSSISKHPLTAIGGITLQNVPDVIRHGARGIALIGAIHDAENPYKTAKEFRNILDSNLEA